MSLFKLFNTGSFRRLGAQGFFALLILPAVFLVMGCSNPASPNFEISTADREWIQTNLAGNWISQFDEETDIAGLRFETMFVQGYIRDVMLFGENSGVLLIELDLGLTNWDTSPLQGFTGFHFANLTASSFNGAMATGADFNGATFTTLQNARQNFTPHTLDTYFANMSSLFQRQSN